MTTTLSEAESKALLSSYGVKFLPEALVAIPTEALAFAEEFDVPMALKLCGSNIAHKSERGLVRLGIVGPDAISRACQELLDAARPEDNATGVLVFGLGGVLAEAIADVTVRLAPLRRHDAFDMLHSLRSQSLFGPFRGEPEVDSSALADLLCALSVAASEIDGLISIDLNPVMVVDGLPIALDALVEVSSQAGAL